MSICIGTASNAANPDLAFELRDRLLEKWGRVAKSKKDSHAREKLPPPPPPQKNNNNN